jgi:hypothetical protein
MKKTKTVDHCGLSRAEIATQQNDGSRSQILCDLLTESDRFFGRMADELVHDVTDGKTLRVVTRHGKKFTFPIREKKQNPPAENPPAA